MKENIKSVVVLTAICLVVSVLLAVTNFYTAPVIEEHKSSAALSSLSVVMPDAEGFEEIPLPDTAPATVKNVYRETSGLGYAVVLTTTSQYSSGDMGITVGIGVDGKICGITLTGYYESKDFGTDTYPNTYIGQDSALGGVDTVAGVTYSSTAFKNAVSDAFSILIEVGDIKEGEKSEEQLIAEIIPLVLPGSVDATGSSKVTETATDNSGITAYKADNNCGYIVVADTENGKIVCGINAFGVVKAFDLDGNDVTGDGAYAEKIELAKNAFAPIASDKLDGNKTAVERAYEDGTALEITPIENVGTFSTVTSAFSVVNDGKTEYAFISEPFGYKEPMKMLYIINENGEIVLYKPLTELIQISEYYTAYTLDESAYKDSFIGKTSDSYSDDMTLIAGATITSNAVATASRDAFAAFDNVKEALAK